MNFVLGELCRGALTRQVWHIGSQSSMMYGDTEEALCKKSVSSVQKSGVGIVVTWCLGLGVRRTIGLNIMFGKGFR